MEKSAPVGTIGYALKSKRDRLGISQEAVAQQMTSIQDQEVSQPNVKRWESGDVEPKPIFYAAIFGWLDVGETEAAGLVLRTRMHFGGISADQAKTWKKRGAGR